MIGGNAGGVALPTASTGQCRTSGTTLSARPRSRWRWKHEVAIARTWLANWQSYPDEWEKDSFDSNGWAWLSADELGEIGKQITTLIKSWADRELPDDGKHREPVFLFARGMPAKP